MCYKLQILIVIKKEKLRCIMSVFRAFPFSDNILGDKILVIKLQNHLLDDSYLFMRIKKGKRVFIYSLTKL